MKARFGFIGTGNMGGTLARAVAVTACKDGILLADRDESKAAALAEEIGAAVSSNIEVAKNCEYIFLGVKPQILPDVLEELAPVLEAREQSAVLVSMAAGVSICDIERITDDNGPIIRIMPNTPAGVGEGMILCCANGAVSDVLLDGFKSAMSAAGRIDMISEGLIDAAGCVSGCGPAYAYMFIEALADGGVRCGLPRAKALEYAAQTVLGAARTVLMSGKHPDLLKDEVCSPGGTTIAGVHALEKGAFRADVMDSVTAAYNRTLELKK